MLFLRLFSIILFSALLSGCSSAPSTTVSYPHNPTVSDEQGRPRDSAVFYFPSADSLPEAYRTHEKSEEPVETCRYMLEIASDNLFRFRAPVLSNYYTGQTIYRFLWLRSFHRPVLLTLQQQPSGATLRTQFLTKSVLSATISEVSFELPHATPAQKEVSRKAFQATLADSAHQAKIAETTRPSVLVNAEETTVVVTPQQWQHFENLLQQVNFWQLPACQPLGALDGAEWLLEGHQPTRYHMVLRQSPGKNDTFRAACVYLLDLSSARKEKRY